MNRVQEAIAEVLGVDESIKQRESAWAEKVQEWEASEEDRNHELIEINRAYEAVIADNRLLGRAIEDLDYLNLFDFGHQIKEVLPGSTGEKTLGRLRRLRHDNPIAKQGIRLIIRFTLGRGITWISKNTEIRDVLMSFWEDEDNKILLTTHEAQKDFLDEAATDGEKFLACFEAPSVEPYLKLAEVPLEEIKDIIYDPNNRRVPIWYKRKYKPLKYDGNREHYIPEENFKDVTKFYLDYRVTDEKLEEVSKTIKIPKKKIATDDDGNKVKMMHKLINPLWTKQGRRGVSELYASREWLRIFKEFMGDRAGINRAAMSIAYKRTVKGGPSAVASITGTLGGRPVGTNDEIGDDEMRQLTKPVSGAIYDRNEAQDIEWMKTDTGAANAKEDARLLLMIGGAGMGTNIHYFGEGGDANLATAQAMELPMVKNYEDWQTWVQNFFMELFAYVLKLAFGDNIPFEADSQEAEDPNQFKIVASATPDEPATMELSKGPEEPKKTTVYDVVSWDFPPIITKDVVKHMTAWAQLTQQVAPGNQIVHKEAIKGALTVLNVPNVDQLMDQIIAEEQRLEAQRQLQRQAMIDSMNNPDMGAGGPGPQVNGKNGQNGGGQPVPGFTKAGQGGDAETKRLAKGKPPIAKIGRVAADKRPGSS